MIEQTVWMTRRAIQRLVQHINEITGLWCDSSSRMTQRRHVLDVVECEEHRPRRVHHRQIVIDVPPIVHRQSLNQVHHEGVTRARHDEIVREPDGKSGGHRTRIACDAQAIERVATPDVQIEIHAAVVVQHVVAQRVRPLNGKHVTVVVDQRFGWEIVAYERATTLVCPEVVLRPMGVHTSTRFTRVVPPGRHTVACPVRLMQNQRCYTLVADASADDNRVLCRIQAIELNGGGGEASQFAVCDEHIHFDAAQLDQLKRLGEETVQKIERIRAENEPILSAISVYGYGAIGDGGGGSATIEATMPTPLTTTL